MTQTLIVPLDGSPVAEAVLPWASLLARRQDLSLTLVRSVPWPNLALAADMEAYTAPELYDEVLDAEREVARTYLSDVQKRLEADGLAVSVIVRDGSAADAIHDVADEQGAVAIAMASHGRGGVKRLVLGSVAERILEQATLPVLLVHPRHDGTVPQPSLDRIAVPLDGSPLAERGLDAAKALVAPEGSIYLIGVAEPVEEPVLGDEQATMVNEEATQEVLRGVEAYLQRLASEASQAGLRASAVARRGRAGSEISAVVNELGANLIVMTTHGRTGPARWVMGSVADEIFRGAEVPVLLVSARTLAARIAGGYRVRDLMTSAVVAVRDDETIISAMRKLSRRRVSGAPVVNEYGELIGIVTEHDLLTWHAHMVDALSKEEAGYDPAEYARHLEQDAIETIMTRTPTSIDEHADLSAAIHVLTEQRLRRVPVVEGRRLVGVLSRADVLRGLTTLMGE